MTLSAAELKRAMADQGWRLNNLYTITDKDGKLVPFRMNWAQQELFEQLWFNNLVLKVRQVGGSTFINIFQLDSAVFNDHMACGVIAHNQEAAEELFRKNIKTPYERLPESLRSAREIEIERAKQLVFDNGSSIRVGTSLRSGTINILHVSEFGKICAQYPHKAREIVTGSLETVGAGNIVFIESTAEGREGYFFDYSQQAQALRDAGKRLTSQDFRFFFFPWWKHPEYRLSPEEAKSVVITERRKKYFDELEAKIGRKLSPGRRAWYVAKAERLGDDMLREYPSTPEEAFQVSIRGAYYAEQMSALRKAGRITKVPYEKSVAVETWWDLGMADTMVIWFVQQVGFEIRVIDCYANSGEGLAHYAKVLQERGYTYSRHIGPHDIKVRELGTGESRLERAEKLGIKFETAPMLSIADGIEAVRNALPNMWFDEEKCADGIKALEHYRKQWNETLGTYSSQPLHDWASHYADSMRTGVTGRAAIRGRVAPARQVKQVSARGWT